MLDAYRNWLHTVSIVGFCIWFVFMASVTCLFLAICLNFMRKLADLKNIPFSKIRSAAQGYVHLIGRGSNPEKPSLTAPLSGKPCIWWSYSINETFGINNNLPDGERAIYTEKTSSDLLQINDGTGACLIDPVFSEVKPAITEIWYSESQNPNAHCPRINASYKFIEHRLTEKDVLFVSGYFHTDDGTPEATQIDDATRALLVRWKKDQPGLIRRFDTNHDGEVNMDEWAKARIEARREVLQKARENAPRTPVNMLSPAPDGRALILNGEPRIRQFRRLYGIICVSFCLAIIYAGLCAYMLEQRFTTMVATANTHIHP